MGGGGVDGVTVPERTAPPGVWVPDPLQVSKETLSGLIFFCTALSLSM